MKSIILAAGRGSRMGNHTNNCPKSLVKLKNIPIIERQITTLKKAGVNDLTILSGYKNKEFEYLGIPQIINPEYESSNMVQSLYCAKELFNGNDDLIISYGDIVYEEMVLDKLIADTKEISVIVDKSWHKLWKIRMQNVLSDAETLKLDENNYIMDIGERPTSIKEIEGQYIGLFKIPSQKTLVFFEVYESLLNINSETDKSSEIKNIQMTKYLKLLINVGIKLQAEFIDNCWLEIDTANDLKLYHSLHKDNQLNKYYKID